ncbi:MAG: hypothetical protein LUD78_05295 [Clostridiales bacterium]|nr:hypothetical protein [Clostridiales bacterium]
MILFHPIVIVIVIVVVLIHHFKVRNSPNAKAVKALCKDKTPEQRKVIEYFCKEGRKAKILSDEEYLAMLRAKRDSLNLRQKALDSLHLDEEKAKGLSPTTFEGFAYKNAYAKKLPSGNWVSSAYQVSWLFFGSTRVHIYRYTFHMDDGKMSENTDELFYGDIVSFSTSFETETARGVGDKRFEVETHKFRIVVPGNQLLISMDGYSDDIIQAMKQKLREKKM